MRPSLTRATGRSQAEWMSGCLCITLQGVMTLVPMDLFASPPQLSPISMCSDHLWWLITLKEVLYKQHLWFIFVYGKKTRTCSTHPASTHVYWEQTRAGDSKQSILHSEWRQQKTTWLQSVKYKLPVQMQSLPPHYLVLQIWMEDTNMRKQHDFLCIQELSLSSLTLSCIPLYRNCFWIFLNSVKWSYKT